MTFYPERKMRHQFTSYFRSHAAATNFAGMVDSDVEPVAQGTAPYRWGARWQVAYFQEIEGIDSTVNEAAELDEASVTVQLSV